MSFIYFVSLNEWTNPGACWSEMEGDIYIRLGFRTTSNSLNKRVVSGWIRQAYNYIILCFAAQTSLWLLTWIFSVKQFGANTLLLGFHNGTVWEHLSQSSSTQSSSSSSSLAALLTQLSSVIVIIFCNISSIHGSTLLPHPLPFPC